MDELDGGFTLKRGSVGAAPIAVQEFSPEPPFAASRFLVPTLAASSSLAIVSSYAIQDSGPKGGGLAAVYMEHYAGPPAGPLERVARCPGEETRFRSVDVSGDAYVFRRCDDDLGHVEIRDAGATPASPPRSVGRGGFGARIAGRFVAWLDGRYSQGSVRNSADLVVYDRVAGAEAYRIPRAEMAWASREEPWVHLLPLKAIDGYDVRIAGDEIAFQRGRVPLAVTQRAEVGIADLAGQVRIVARDSDATLRDESFDFDGRRLAWRELACERRLLMIRGADSEAAPRRRACPLRVLSRPRSRNGTVELDPSSGAMVPPCTFSIRLRTAERGPDVDVGASSGRTGPVRVRLKAAARRMLAARGSLRLTATAFIVDTEARTDTRRTTFRVRRRASRHPQRSIRLMPRSAYRGLLARMVDPIAPNFLALRRVSSNAERA